MTTMYTPRNATSGNALPKVRPNTPTTQQLTSARPMGGLGAPQTFTAGLDTNPLSMGYRASPTPATNGLRAPAGGITNQQIVGAQPRGGLGAPQTLAPGMSGPALGMTTYNPSAGPSTWTNNTGSVAPSNVGGQIPRTPIAPAPRVASSAQGTIMPGSTLDMPSLGGYATNTGGVSRQGYDPLTGHSWSGDGTIYSPAQGVGPGGVPLPTAGNGLGAPDAGIANAVADAGGWNQYMGNVDALAQQEMATNTQNIQGSYQRNQDRLNASRNYSDPNAANRYDLQQKAKAHNDALRAERRAGPTSASSAPRSVAGTQSATAQGAASPSAATSPPPAPVAPPPSGLLDVSTVNQQTDPIYGNKLMNRIRNQQLADMARFTPEAALKAYERGGVSRSAGTQSLGTADLARHRAQSMGNVAQDQFGMQLANQQNTLDQQYRREMEALGLARGEFGLQDAYRQFDDQNRQRQLAILNAMLRGAGALSSFGGGGY